MNNESYNLVNITFHIFIYTSANKHTQDIIQVIWCFFAICLMNDFNIVFKILGKFKFINKRS